MEVIEMFLVFCLFIFKLASRLEGEYYMNIPR